MTKHEAETLLAIFFAQFGRDAAAFEQSNAVKANIGEAILGFEFREREAILACSALIYQFRNPPRPQILSGIKREIEEGADTGGGEINLDSENKTLSLVRIYRESVAPDDFTSDMKKLAAASLKWSSEILDRVAG